MTIPGTINPSSPSSRIPKRHGSVVIIGRRGERNHGLGRCFQPIGWRALREVKRGTLVWFADEHVSASGGVDGMRLVEFGTMSRKDEGKFWVSFTMGGTLIESDKPQGKFYRVRARRRLEGLIAQYPHDVTVPRS